MLKVCALASGSKGNCYYIGDESYSLLVDAGLPFSEIKNRLSDIGVDINSVSAILNTHSHIDHIRGLDMFLKHTDAQVFSHHNGAPYLQKKVKGLSNINWVVVDGSFYIGDICVMPVEVSHDVPCVCYIFTKKNKKISIVTDLGYTNTRLLNNISNSNIVYIESNYDEQMLKTGVYPPVLKNRIASSRGHLSNNQCAQICERVINDNTDRIVLSHISQNNNTEILACESFLKHFESKQIIFRDSFRVDVAHQDKISTMYKII